MQALVWNRRDICTPIQDWHLHRKIESHWSVVTSLESTQDGLPEPATAGTSFCDPSEGKVDEIVHRSLPKLWQAHLHDEDGQHNKNTRDNIPEAHRMPLESAVTVCERQCKGSQQKYNRVERTDVIMIPEHAGGSSESRDTEDTAEVKLDSFQTGWMCMHTLTRWDRQPTASWHPREGYLHVVYILPIQGYVSVPLEMSLLQFICRHT